MASYGGVQPQGASGPSRYDNEQSKQDEPVYMCGDCGSDNTIRPKEPIRCGECGCRIMYKKRVQRMVQFEAR